MVRSSRADCAYLAISYVSVCESSVALFLSFCVFLSFFFLFLSFFFLSFFLSSLVNLCIKSILYFCVSVTRCVAELSLFCSHVTEVCVYATCTIAIS